MSTSWCPDFDTWSYEKDGKAFVFHVDLAAAPHGPLESHLTLVMLRLAPPTSQPARAELPVPHALEDQLTACITEALGAIFVGSIASEGATWLAFYAPLDARADELLPPIVSSAAPYDVRWRATLEPDWRCYYRLLYPNESRLLDIVNRRRLALREQRGDRLGRERLVNAERHPLAVEAVAAVDAADAGDNR